MTASNSRVGRAAAVLSLGLAAAPRAEPPLPAGPFDDQFDRPHEMTGCRRLILFAPDRDAAAIAGQALDGLDGAALARRGVCYVADIGRMPGLVTRTFALPALGELACPVLLGRNEADTAMPPRQAGKVTLLSLGRKSQDPVVYQADPVMARRALDGLGTEPAPP